MSDVTLPLTYNQRSMLISALTAFMRVEMDRDLDFYSRFYKTDVETVLLAASRLECQPGGCEYCNSDRAREAMEDDYA